MSLPTHRVTLHPGSSPRVPPPSAVGIDCSTEVGLHHIRDIIVRPGASHKSPDVLQAVIKAILKIDIVTASNQDGLVPQPDMAGTEGAVGHGEVAEVVGVQVVDCRNLWLQHIKAVKGRK